MEAQESVDVRASSAAPDAATSGSETLLCILVRLEHSN